MLGKLIGKIIAAPIRVVNIPVKATKAVFDVMCDEPVEFEENALDGIADVVEETARKVVD